MEGVICFFTYKLRIAFRMNFLFHRGQCESETFGLPAQKAFFSCAALFGIAEANGVEGGAVFDHGVKDAGQLLLGICF